MINILCEIDEPMFDYDEATLFICSKFGFDVHVNDEKFGMNQAGVSLSTGFVPLYCHPSLNSCIQQKMNIFSFMINSWKFEWPAGYAKYILTSIFAVDHFSPIDTSLHHWRVGNPFIGHNELMNCTDIYEFKIMTDLICPGDALKKKNFAFFKKHGLMQPNKCFSRTKM